MANKLLTLAYNELKKKKYDAYYLSLSNENLYEFTKDVDNYLVELTGFTGDTGALLITNEKSYLYVDGRFTIQAKREINDKSIKIVEINKNSEKIKDIVSRIKKNSKIALNPKAESINQVLAINEECKKKSLKLVYDISFLSNELSKAKKNCFNLTSAPLFLLERPYVGEDTKKKIYKLLSFVGEIINGKSDFYYATSNLEEIAYLTNLRYRFCDIAAYGVLFDSFLIVNRKKSILYIKDYLEEKAFKYINNSNIVIKGLEDFYTDLKKISKNNQVYIDKRINNYYIYKCLNLKSNCLIDSPLYEPMSIKGDVEIKNIRKSNILDGIAMTKALYKLKKVFCDKGKDKEKFNDEYSVKVFVDNLRRKVGKKYYLCESFETIVAYKENSAICHYIPQKSKSKKISSNSILLIDSGANYLFGTTDITRTISLYSDKNKIPDKIKMHYTLVLKSMINLSKVIFPYGLTGSEIDIMAREDLYKKYLDFNHGTGHGIGYISNVHEGPNRIGPGINNNYEKNVMQAYQVTSNEPGLYFEGKYGIRIENDLLTVPKRSNEFGDFLSFETLTLCPYDRDLIDKKYLDNETIDFLNTYNKRIYKLLSKHLSDEERKWLKKETREV